MDEALSAIHDTALQLLLVENVDQLHKGLEVIVSLADTNSMLGIPLIESLEKKESKTNLIFILGQL